MIFCCCCSFLVVKSTGLDDGLDIRSEAHKDKTCKAIIGLYRIHCTLKKIQWLVFCICEIYISVLSHRCVTELFNWEAAEHRRKNTGTKDVGSVSLFCLFIYSVIHLFLHSINMIMGLGHMLGSLGRGRNGGERNREAGGKVRRERERKRKGERKGKAMVPVPSWNLQYMEEIIGRGDKYKNRDEGQWERLVAKMNNQPNKLHEIPPREQIRKLKTFSGSQILVHVVKPMGIMVLFKEPHEIFI